MRTHLHPCQVNGFVHQEPRGRLEAGRNGHGAVVGYKTAGLWVHLLDVEASQEIGIVWSSREEQGGEKRAKEKVRTKLI